MKKSTFYVAFGMLATTGTSLFGLSAARIAQAQQETQKSVIVREAKPGSDTKSGTIRCLTRTPTQEEMQDDEKQVQAFLSRTPDAGRLRGPGARNPGEVVIPVWFHIIMTSSGQGSVTDSQIYAQLRVMNTGYSGTERYATQLHPIPAEQPTANTICRFVLAGIDRTTNNAYYNSAADTPSYQAMKTELRKGEGGDGKTGPKTLNVYLKYLDGLGISTFPQDYASAPLQDGVVCITSSIPNGTEPHYNLGKTLTHEVGHWLGLYHTFQGGCATSAAGVDGDSVVGDGVSDTPAESAAYFGSVPTSAGAYPNRCTGANFPGRDPIENYMDYSDDDVLVQFTAGQDARIDTRIATYRGL